MDWRVYLAKAKKTLRTAQGAYDHGDFDSCASRSYFAVFQVGVAALLNWKNHENPDYACC